MRRSMQERFYDWLYNLPKVWFERAFLIVFVCGMLWIAEKIAWVMGRLI